MASITTQNKRKARARTKAGITEASLWRYKREQQRAWLASGRNGAWFTGGMARNAKIIDAPY
jgi:hypothetical protein